MGSISRPHGNPGSTQENHVGLRTSASACVSCQSQVMTVSQMILPRHVPARTTYPRFAVIRLAWLDVVLKRQWRLVFLGGPCGEDFAHRIRESQRNRQTVAVYAGVEI